MRLADRMRERAAELERSPEGPQAAIAAELRALLREHERERGWDLEAAASAYPRCPTCGGRVEVVQRAAVHLQVNGRGTAQPLTPDYQCVNGHWYDDCGPTVGPKQDMRA